MISKITKISSTIALTIVTLTYLFFIVMVTPIPLLRSSGPPFLFAMSLLGLLGLVGLWLLLLIDNFKNHKLRRITIIFLICGIISAFYVSNLAFKASLTNGFLGYMISWGLRILSVVTLIIGKIKLFPTKK